MSTISVIKFKSVSTRGQEGQGMSKIVHKVPEGPTVQFVTYLLESKVTDFITDAQLHTSHRN